GRRARPRQARPAGGGGGARRRPGGAHRGGQPLRERRRHPGRHGRRRRRRRRGGGRRLRARARPRARHPARRGRRRRGRRGAAGGQGPRARPGARPRDAGLGRGGRGALGARGTLDGPVASAMDPLRPVDLILAKRAGQEHAPAELTRFIDAYVAGEVPDYQVAAWLMAVCWRGMTDAETAALTQAMARSGDMLDLSGLPHTVDKHSTGGVGDKTTLVLAPLLAAMGGTVAKMSGRGLGHTGGTVDKLESIPGFRSSLSDEEFLAQARAVGAAVTGQSKDLAPADGLLYALRDATGTVESLPLIASSIMSKKLAGGAHAIVLDVKVGAGAFMKTLEEARELARAMTAIGGHAGREVRAVLSDMSAPLGRTVGNAIEVEEAVRCLRGEGPD